MKRKTECIGDAIGYLLDNCIPVGELKVASQKTLASIVGRADSTISDYRHGNINVKVEVVADILAAYGYELQLIALPMDPIEGDIDMYCRCMDLNRVLTELPRDDVRRILMGFDISINI